MLKLSKLVVKEGARRKVPRNDELKGAFGKVFSDHMLVAEWDGEWGAPRIEPFGDLKISPAASSLHYALQCFEGMKAYRGDDDVIRLFRPDLNAARLNESLDRLAMPRVENLVEAVGTLVSHDRRFVPSGDGFAAYLRPTVIATDPHLGVGPPNRCLFFALLSPVGPYFPAGFNPIVVYADTQYVRAWPGGCGGNKVGANYGPTILPQQLAARRHGASQVLYCPDGRITEVGSMNFFAVVGDDLITPPLDMGDILPGVTRRSILDLAPDLGLNPVERPFHLEDLHEAARTGRLREVFGAGTAAIVAPIKAIVTDQGGTISTTATSVEGLGPVAGALFSRLTDIHYGRDPSHAHWTVPIVQPTKN
ncbi:hypothetical protein CTAYLR_009644 [Chrysophaeum taylorii]|uniref:Branched-chain-amino-acid aminotransferase n=1 Tax=Chrysophaeum taylorii TaxID=2483200 RepID=A0AAD7XF39_9STRA|nr:hypothetical protein CTAYLR_009644 [Chrysophaeum taylorii]